MLHIGEQIRAIFKTSNLTVTEFAKRIGTSRENVYAIFKRKSLDSDLLTKISKVLDHDFFMYLVDKEKLYRELEEISEKLRASEEKVAYLTRLNTFLEKELDDKKTDKDE